MGLRFVYAAQADEFYNDLFVTAMEGGVNTWADVRSYNWDDLRNFSAILVDFDSGKKHLVNRNVIARGYKMARSADIYWSSGERPPMIPSDDWDYDAGDADMIVQLGLFGEVVYG